MTDATRADHLTAALRRTGVLDTGRVAGVAVESTRETMVSRLTRLRLTYEGAAGDAPATIMVKSALPGRERLWAQRRPREVDFYRQVEPVTPPGRTLRCYEAHADETGDGWHLLLEDLTDSHATATVWPLPPDHAQAEAIVGALARFHAAWWDDTRLGDTVGAWIDEAAAAQRLGDFATRYEAFADRLGDNLPAERRALYERFIAATPRLMGRVRDRRHVTVVHGDAHTWNCLLPKRAGDDARLFDWDSWRLDVAADDVAYLMAMHWFPDRRARLERPLLDHYHRTLEAHGVAGYDRAALEADYRRGVLMQLRRPVWQASFDIPPVIWWLNLERIMLAIDDLGCRDLLD